MSVRSVCLAGVAWVAAAWTAAGAAGADLDWSAWERLPVFDGGRMMPLDSFARAVASRVCGRESPTLALSQALPGVDVETAEYAGARQLFPGGKPRKFQPAELVFSWLVEADRWERVPFLAAEHHELREEILGLPRSDDKGRPIKYVSPREVETSEGLRRWREDLPRRRSRAEKEGREFKSTGVDRKAHELIDAYNCWRELTFSPEWLASESSLFVRRLVEAGRTWSSASEAIEHEIVARGGPREAFEAFRDSLDGLRRAASEDRPSLEKLEPPAARLRSSARTLALWFEEQNAETARRLPEIEPARQKELLAYAGALASRTRDLARQATDVQTALFDNTPVSPGRPQTGGALRLTPALNPFALEENRTPEENPQPWLTVQALLMGSPETLDDYPAGRVEEVRKAFRGAAAVYLAREAGDRPQRFAAAVERLAGAVRALGEEVNPLRAKLRVRKLDEAALAATQYPPPGAMDVEVHYNRVQPFLWSWVTCLAAVVFFSLSFGAARRPMFWAGAAALAVAQLLIVYGLGLRTVITGWAPVTNMFETVVFVALVVAGLGLWFAIAPLVWPGLRAAWQLTAAPGTWEARRPAGEGPGMPSPGTQSAVGWLLLAPRAALALGVFYALTQVHYGEGEGYAVVALSPRVKASGALTANDLVTWGVGLAMLAASVWYAPRALLAALLGPFTVPWSLRRVGLAKPLEQVLARKAFAFSGAAVGLVAAMAAYYVPAPVLDKSISPLRPVLRDNFWLAVHVLSITASYGAGALALGLGNVSLFHYLFGKYRDPAPPSAEAAARGHRPAAGFMMPREIHRREPAACAALAAFTYKATQVAVLLLAAGTILGALWADVAWGRFWGWDAKEVWALISLLVYLVILHGRYAGLFGNFGLAAFSVAGATSIMMAWYGVNFVLDVGLHSYGRGSGGLYTVLSFIALNWLFMGAAAVRYRIEVRAETPGNAAPGPSSPGATRLLETEFAAKP